MNSVPILKLFENTVRLFFLPIPIYLYIQLSIVTMKPSLQRKENIAQAPGRNAARVKKATNRQKGQLQKTSGVLPFNATEVVSQHLSITEPPTGTQKEIRAEVDPSAKIKLQLFPVDEVTRIGLEKDGLNPFLELTLKARKKISSVIKHIHTKWGCSSIAIGEPMLVAYDAHLRHPTASKRWTLKDTVITAGDVYKAVESPAIFRLSYGWFSDPESQRVPAVTPLYNCIKSESIHKPIETTEERKCLEASAQVASTAHVDTEVNMGHSHERSSFPQVDDITNLTIGGLLSEASEMGKISINKLKSSQPVSLCTDISIGGFLSEASLQGKLHTNNNEQVVDGRNMTGHQETPVQWDDSLTALSIGGLLSEASLQARINNKTDLSATFISDSFGISSQLKSNSQVAKLDSRSSILDAEETCHAFAFRKFSSSSKSVRVSTRATQDLSSNSFRFPHLPEVEKQGMHAEDACCPEPKMELFLRPQQFGEDSRSLGLRGITWNESLGPFDLGNSMPWKICDGGNI